MGEYLQVRSLKSIFASGHGNYYFKYAQLMRDLICQD